MNRLTMRYTVLFFTRTMTRELPGSWGEMNAAQLVAVSRITGQKETDYLQFLTEYTSIGRKLIQKMTPIVIYHLTRLMGFIEDPELCCSSFIIKRIKGSRYYAPADKLAGMGFGQFIFVQSHYREWITGGNTESLYRFVAALYLTRNEKFDHEKIAVRGEKIAHADPEWLKAVALNYTLVLRWLQKRYPLVFRQKKEGEQMDEKKGTGESEWIKCFNLLVGDDLIHRDEYAELPLHAVLRYLSRKYLENAKR